MWTLTFTEGHAVELILECQGKMWKDGGQGALFQGQLNSCGGPPCRRGHWVSEYSMDSLQTNSASIPCGSVIRAAENEDTQREPPLLHRGGGDRLIFSGGEMRPPHWKNPQ